MQSREVSVKKLVLIGIGLIGGSLARALRRAGIVEEIVGVSRSFETGELAVSLGVIDRYVPDPGEAVENASLIVVATPILTYPAIFRAIVNVLPDDAVVTDVGSVKGYVVDTAREQLGTHFERFVPGHPIAGTEKSGVRASFAELFEKRCVVLTPLTETQTAAVSLVSEIWRHTGADVVNMDVVAHDRLLAATSHLPHVVAYTLVSCLANHPERDVLFELAAGGFYDFTRIASSDPAMWRDICLTNRESILEILGSFTSSLQEITEAIRVGDGERLEEHFYNAKLARDGGMEKKRKNAI